MPCRCSGIVGVDAHRLRCGGVTARGHTAKSTVKCCPTGTGSGAVDVGDDVAAALDGVRAPGERRAARLGRVRGRRQAAIAASSAGPHRASLGGGRLPRREQRVARCATRCARPARAAGRRARRATSWRARRCSASAPGVNVSVPTMNRSGNSVNSARHSAGTLPPPPCSLRNARSHQRFGACASMARTASARSKPECAHSTRASGSWRKMRSIASTSECACSTSLCSLASATMRFGHRQVGIGAVQMEFADRGVARCRAGDPRGTR